MAGRFISEHKDIQARSKPAGASVTLVAAMVWFVSAIGLMTAFGPALLWMLVAASLSVCLTPLLLQRDEPRLVAPLYLTLAYLALSYPIKFIACASGMEYVDEEYPGLFSDDGLMSEVFAVFIAGVASYLIGYRYPPQGIMRWLTLAKFPVFGLPTRSWPWRAVIVALIGWSSVLLQVVLGTWSTFAGLGENWNADTNQLFSYLYQYAWFGYIAAVLWLSSRNSDRSMLGWACCGTIISGTFLAGIIVLGSKTWLVYPVYWLIMAAYMVGRRPPWWLTALILVPMIAFTFSFVGAYRSIYTEDYGSTSAMESSLFGVAKGALAEDQHTEFSEKFGMFLNRLGGVDNAAQVVTLFPRQYEFQYFYDLLLTPFSAIPRIILPFKPRPQSPTFYSEEVAGMIYGGSAAPHPLAEGYLNFGFLGVIFLFWIWGSMQAFLYRGFYLPRQDNLVVGTVYAFYMLEFVGFGGWITGMITGLPGQIVVLIPLLLILNNAKGRLNK